MRDVGLDIGLHQGLQGIMARVGKAAGNMTVCPRTRVHTHPSEAPLPSTGSTDARTLAFFFVTSGGLWIGR